MPRLARLLVMPLALAPIALAQPPARPPAGIECRLLASAEPTGSVDALRARGPEGLSELLGAYEANPDPAMLAKIDAVAAQKDAIWSRLYWHTDLASAQARARAEHKPILYLRLLGKLTDEFSCANSRFFRTVLYANPDVATIMRERFVLVWESERPVPVVTIDYGDGRTLKRTITGNSAHYVLDANANVVDVLPGLIDPVAFARVLGSAADAAAQPSARPSYLAQQIRQIDASWSLETSNQPERLIGVPQTPPAKPASAPPTAPIAERADARAIVKSRAGEGRLVREPRVPDAMQAAPRAIGKSMGGERAMLSAIEPLWASGPASPSTADETLWSALADRHRPDARLHARSLALMGEQNPEAFKDADARQRTIDNFERSIAEDSVRNLYRFRRQALVWLLESRGRMSLADVNSRVYAELFLTPRTDPWLGLVPADRYTGLSEGSCVIAHAYPAHASSTTSEK